VVSEGTSGLVVYKVFHYNGIFSLVYTAPSSPVIREIDTPEADIEPLSLNNTSGNNQLDDLHEQAKPLYPLPSKPFLVQPLPKIGSGFAPTIPLEKNKAPARHWRKAKREIRGIAGGRWFACTWVGDKDSDYATSTQLERDKAKEARDRAAGIIPSPSVALPKPPVIPQLKGPMQKLAAKDGGGSTAASSRSTSVVPDVPSHAVRQQSKMRQLVAGADSADENTVDLSQA
jgi:Wiskott-Aldrich syndrome protein